MASHARPFQEDRPIPTRPYPELRTWMVVRSGVISVFPTHSGNAPASPDIRPTTWLCPTCLPNTSSITAPIQPTVAMTTTHIHQLRLTRPPSTRSSSASEDHPQAPVVPQQQQQPDAFIINPTITGLAVTPSMSLDSQKQKRTVTAYRTQRPHNKVQQHSIQQLPIIIPLCPKL